jgi:Flp pilus assembly protein TadD
VRFKAALILAAGILVYANSLNRPFIFDDQSIVDYNTQFREWPSLRMFDIPQESPVAGRPLPNLSFVINYTLGKDDPRGYHAFNLAVHLACALLIFGLVRRTLLLPYVGRTFRSAGPEGPAYVRTAETMAFASALIWTIHPLNTEVVDYLMQRTESMMAFCYLLTLYASLRAVQGPGSGVRSAWPIVATLACAAGMASKESMVTAPLAVVLYDRVFLFGSWRQSLRARWPLYAALAATWLVLGALMLSSPRTFSAGFTNIHISSWNYFLNQMIAITQYLRLAVWPVNLVLFYGWALPLGVADVWPYALFLFALLGATIVALIRRPALGFLGAWVALTLAPSSSIAPIAAEVAAERRMYLPLIAIVVLVVVGVSYVGRVFRPGARGGPKGPPYVLPALLSIVAIALGSLTILRNREYASSLTMAQTVLERWPTPIAHDMVGTTLAAQGRHDEAIVHLREAVKGYPPARYNLGAELLGQGRVEEAAPLIDGYAREQPNDARGRAGRIALGMAYEATGRAGLAVVQYQALIDARPEDVEAHGLLARALAADERFLPAIPHYEKFVEAFPNDAGGWTGLGIALVGARRVPDAVSAFRQAVAASPNDGALHRNLARALLTNGDVAAAGASAKSAVSLSPNDPGSHAVLGHVLLTQGKISEARTELTQALALDPNEPVATALLNQTKREGVKR